MEAIKLGWYKRKDGAENIIKVVGEHESGDAFCHWAFDETKGFRYHPFEFNKDFEPVTEEFVNSIERQCCPDHASVPQVFEGSVSKEAKPDYWRVNAETKIRTCSYCGSIHTDDLLKLVAEHGVKIIGKTDKSYKWYVNIPGQTYKYYRTHDTQEFIDALNAIITKTFKELKL